MSDDLVVPHPADDIVTPHPAAPPPPVVDYDALGFCPCCGSLFGCYCHEYPHWDVAVCPGGNVVPFQQH